jgi:hypothetical protein
MIETVSYPFEIFLVPKSDHKYELSLLKTSSRPTLHKMDPQLASSMTTPPYFIVVSVPGSGPVYLKAVAWRCSLGKAAVIRFLRPTAAGKHGSKTFESMTLA